MNEETKTNKIFSDSHHRTPLKETGAVLYSQDLEEAAKNIVFTWWINEERADTFEIESVVFRATGSQHTLPIPEGKEACHWCGYLEDEGHLKKVGNIELELCRRCYGVDEEKNHVLV